MPTVPFETRKSQRINLRTTERQEALLRRAAEATEHTLTDFIMDSAVENAHRVLADRRCSGLGCCSCRSTRST